MGGKGRQGWIGWNGWDGRDGKGVASWERGWLDGRDRRVGSDGVGRESLELGRLGWMYGVIEVQVPVGWKCFGRL